MTWFRPWLDQHLRRHATKGLPSYDEAPELYEAWRSEMALRRIDEQTAHIASTRLVGKRHFKNEHFVKLLGLCWKYGPRKPEAAAPDATRQASADCKVCGGMGCVCVTEDVFKATWAAFCECDFGRLLLDSARKALEKDGKRPIDFKHVKDGVTFRVVHNGTEHHFQYRPLDSSKGRRNGQDLPRRAARSNGHAGLAAF